MRDSFDAEGTAGPTAATDPATPEVTVAMPARNAARFIGQAIESVLGQRDVALELIVVDDHSDDDTAKVAESFRDPRLTVLRNDRRRGIAGCHNTILRMSRARYVAHVDADDFLLPGALGKMIDALRRDPNAGQAHCYFFDVDTHGRMTRDSFAKRWTAFRRNRTPTLDYRKALMMGSVANGLRTFPRRVLEELGGFDERLPYGVDYDMAVRIVDRFAIKVVPEFLYGRRVHDTNTTGSLRFTRYRLWAIKYVIRRRLVREGRVSFLSGSQFDLYSFLHGRTAMAVREARPAAAARARRVWMSLRWRVLAPLAAAAFRAARRRLSWWPLAWSRAEPRPVAAHARRVAYWVRLFPALSETFIQREVAALINLGLPVEVIAEETHGAEHFDAQARWLMERTHYLGAPDRDAPNPHFRTFLRRRPLRLLNAFCYLAFRRHTAHDAFAPDRATWLRALGLAGELHKRGVTHVHSPWATNDALVALLAARLVGARYTVQARASDLHKDVQQFGLSERLGRAELIITNARYNEPVIRSKLPPGIAKPIHTIYEGVDLTRLRPAARVRHPGQAPLVLCVARLVEPKGLEYLLHACRMLRDEGRSVRCEIVGGRNALEMNYYIALKKLHRTLSLESDVLFSGPRSFDRVLEKFAEADVYTLPAVQAADGRRDVTPNTLIEAMAMKLPIVSTRSGAIPELIEDGVTGLLVPSRDAEALAQAIGRLLDDEVLRTTLGEAARRRVEERFDIAKNVESYASLFDLVPGGPGVNGRTAN